MSEDKRVRLAIIAGAAAAAEYMKKNWKATPEEIIRHVSDNVPAIVEKIDDSL